MHAQDAEYGYSLDLRNLPNLSKSIEQKLNQIHIHSILDLATAIPKDLLDAGISMEKAEELCLRARLYLLQHGFIEKQFLTAEEALQKRVNLAKIPTGSKSLDTILGGGVETQAITELIGEYGSGKTQICHTLCVTVQPMGAAIYIDTESTFRPERLAQIAEARGLDSSEVLENVITATAYNASHLQLMVKELGRRIEQHGAKLVVVDSVVSHFRAEYIGRDSLAERQQKLNETLHRLLRTAQIHNTAVVVTNQVVTNPNTFHSEANKPSGGHVLAHSSTYRIYIKKIGDIRTAKIIDSPYHPPLEARFRITEKGVEDVEHQEQP